MTNEQRAALRSLERALKKCAEAGLVLQGMDGTLLICDKQALMDNGYNEDPVAAMKATDDETETVQDHGAYLDSGGW